LPGFGGGVNDDLEETRRLLELEYHKAWDKIASLEDARYKIKGWAITATAGILALGVNAHRTAIVLLGLLVALPMAFVEANYLARQQSFLDRSGELEIVMEAIRRKGPGPETQAYVFGLAATINRRLSAWRMTLMFSRRSNAGYLYIVLLIVTVAVAVGMR
jgi:hypothetical protein